MALQKDVVRTSEVFTGSLHCADVYYKITKLTGDKTNLDVELKGTKNGQQIDGFSFSFIPTVEEGSSNFIAQAYEHVKTLPEFADAVDC